MRYFDIETGQLSDGSWGYKIHDYGKGPEDGFKYNGDWGTVGGFKGDEEAYNAAAKRLNKSFGKKGWTS